MPAKFNSAIGEGKENNPNNTIWNKKKKLKSIFADAVINRQSISLDNRKREKEREKEREKKREKKRKRERKKKREKELLSPNWPSNSECNIINLCNMGEIQINVFRVGR